MRPPPLRRFALICLFGHTALVAWTAEPIWPAWRAPLIEKMSGEIVEVNDKLVKKPDSVAFLSHRGDLYLFLGAYPQAVADFEKMIALDPSQDVQHWRLGIAYYFAGQFEKSKRQFAKYHAYDGRDRENGIWEFLAQEKADGVEKARAEMFTYAEFDREPFPSLYEMFAGKRTPDEVLTDMEKRGLFEDKQASFFGYYYTGVQEALLGHRAHAIELLRKAVDILPGPDTVYMWNVARLYWEQLVREQSKTP